jgi:hypothetical protein
LVIKMNKSLEKCPICSHELTITKVFCEQCGTSMSGQFGSTGSRFTNLTEEQMEFLMAFIRCEGKFNRLEDELKLSYPTLRNRFNDILAAMGFEGNQSDAEHTLSKVDRIEILQKLDLGTLNPEQAELMLRGKGELP